MLTFLNHYIHQKNGKSQYFGSEGKIYLYLPKLYEFLQFDSLFLRFVFSLAMEFKT